jgi:long-chain acyl-CoA synthetase
VPAKDALRDWLRHAGLSAKTSEGQEAALRLIESELAKHREGGELGGNFPSRWLPSAVAILGEAFTEQNHMLNSTMKMVRGKIVEFYRTRIDYLYTPEGKSILNAHNRAIVARME